MLEFKIDENLGRSSIGTPEFYFLFSVLLNIYAR